MKIFFKIIMAILVVTSACVASAELMPVKPGKVYTYYSDNGKYEVSIEYGEGFVSWSLKEDGTVLWRNPVPDDPGEASVSDNGETITLPLWGWRDEGGSNGVAVYDKKGKLVKKIFFKEKETGMKTLRWVRETSISPGGQYIAVGEDGQENASVALFETGSGEMIWENISGLPDMVDIKIAKGGKYVLVATREDGGSGMEFRLFDGEGTVLADRKIDDNFSYDVDNYMRFTGDGPGFEVYDLASGEYISG